MAVTSWDRFRRLGVLSGTYVRDLEGLEFCDGQGLAAIDQARRRFGIGKDLILQNPPKTLRKLLHITGLEREFKPT